MANQATRPVPGPSPKLSRQTQPASFLLEAVLAAATALTALALIAPMFAKQVAMARRARDIQQLDEMVSKDINAYRQYARYWKQKSGNYSGNVINKDVAALPPADPTYAENPTTVFNPSTTDCAPTNVRNSPLVFAYTTDTGAMRPIGGDTLGGKVMEIGNYTLVRTIERNAESQGLPFLRLIYTAQPRAMANGEKAPDLSFVRTAEIQIQAQNWC